MKDSKIKKNEIWDPSVFSSSPIIKQLSSVTTHFSSLKEWPTIDEYKKIFNQYSMQVMPVEQAQHINSFDEQYEPRVFLKNELQTRTHNWHDFFNALIWLTFPETKKTLNDLHYSQAKNRDKGSNRTLLENRITQFDECGAIIISKNEALLELIRQHKWQELFIDNRHQFKDNLQCILFGHALFEKALNPYIGMTCHCLLINENEFEVMDRDNLDTFISKLWKNKLANAPGKLNAFPLLGLPGYWPEQNKNFYSNQKYFR